MAAKAGALLPIQTGNGSSSIDSPGSEGNTVSSGTRSVNWQNDIKRHPINRIDTSGRYTPPPTRASTAASSTSPPAQNLAKHQQKEPLQVELKNSQAGAQDAEYSAEIKQVIDRIARVDSEDAKLLRASARFIFLTFQRLPFYAGLAQASRDLPRLLLLDVARPERPDQFLYFDEGDRIFAFEARGDPKNKQFIQELNQRKKLALEEEQAASYLQFFLTCCESPDRWLIQSSNDIRWASDDRADESLHARKQAVEAWIHPIAVQDLGEGFHCKAVFQDGSRLVESGFVVKTDGEVTKLGEQILVENLP
ncbi:hypothetical protein [Hyalangium minutum]|uniref:hypothetical protein n=1 Tax=Hyalangium minutum TaxID=394096 RepID=UPI0012FB0514|nr:hypothetical protein [Hyalangium minutum]